MIHVCIWLKNMWQTLQLFMKITMVIFKRQSLKALSAFKKKYLKKMGWGAGLIFLL